MTEEMEQRTKTQSRGDDGKIQKASETPDKAEIICPLVLMVSKGQSAVNYDVTWTTTIDLGNGPGAWKSAPQQRGHSDAFYEKLKEMREQGQITWEESAYYFTHEEGVAARKKYEQLVLAGKVKANKKSWNNRFEGFTSKSFDELVKEFPDLYSTTTPRAKKAESTEETKPVETTRAAPAALDLDDIEPSEDDIMAASDETEQESEIEASLEPESEEDKAEIAAVETLERPALDLDQLGEPDMSEDYKDFEGRKTSEISAEVFKDATWEKIDTKCEAVRWKSTADNEHHTAFLVDIPEFREVWVEKGLNVLVDPETNTEYRLHVKIDE